jgi:hypothetical protein
MLGVLRASHPFKVSKAVIGAGLIAVIDVDVEWRGWRAQEGENNQTMGELCKGAAITEEGEVEVAVVAGGAAQEPSGGFSAKTALGRDFVAREVNNRNPLFEWGVVGKGGGGEEVKLHEDFALRALGIIVIAGHVVEIHHAVEGREPRTVGRHRAPPPYPLSVSVSVCINRRSTVGRHVKTLTQVYSAFTF